MTGLHCGAVSFAENSGVVTISLAVVLVQVLQELTQLVQSLVGVRRTRTRPSVPPPADLRQGWQQATHRYARSAPTPAPVSVPALPISYVQVLPSFCSF